MATSSPQAYFAAIAFYERAFGAGQVGDRFTGPGGELIHAEIRIGDSVVIDGSAVLGLGDIGPRAALPVLEGKAALYQRFAGIDAWPLCLEAREVPEMVRCISAVAAGFGGVSLEDIAAPRCFDLER